MLVMVDNEYQILYLTGEQDLPGKRDNPLMSLRIVSRHC